MLNLNARSVFIASPPSFAFAAARLRQDRQCRFARGVTGDANAAAYSASKSAVLRLTESMARRSKEHGIKSTACCPVYNTPPNRQAMPDAIIAAWVEPEALADVILFLAFLTRRAPFTARALPVYGRS